MFVAPSFCWIEERVLSLLLRAYMRWCEVPLLPPTPKLGLGWVGSRDTLQVHPCKLRRAIHGAQGPVNPPTPSLDSLLVALGKPTSNSGVPLTPLPDPSLG